MSTRQPILPTGYRVPWDTKLPMFPALRDASPFGSPSPRRKPRPVLLSSTFGPQVDSRKCSMQGCSFAGSPFLSPLSRHRKGTPREFSEEGPLPMRVGVRQQFLLDAPYTPGPLNYYHCGSVGPQPLSPFPSSLCVSLHQNEDRWEPGNRLRRLNMTPAPNAYYPR